MDEREWHFRRMDECECGWGDTHGATGLNFCPNCGEDARCPSSPPKLLLGIVRRVRWVVPGHVWWKPWTWGGGRWEKEVRREDSDD